MTSWKLCGRASWAIARQVALTLGAVLGLACIASAVAAAVVGVRPLVVESGSMSPAIPAGAVAFARSVPAADLHVGDVVSVETDSGGRVMHRVVSATLEGADADSRSDGVVDLTLRGDANQAPDAEVYRVGTADRVLLSVPLAGYAVAWLRSPLGLLAVGALALVALSTLLRPGDRRVGAAAVLAIGAVALSACGAAEARGTTAYFTDTATVASGPLAAASIASPGEASCSSDLVSATIAWPADPRLDYQVVLRRTSTRQVVSTREVAGGDSSATYAVQTDFGEIVGVGPVGFDVEIRSRLASSPTWTSATPRVYSAIQVLGVEGDETVVCTA
jgi:signal peptidase I